MKTKKQKTPVKKKFVKDCGRCGYQHDKGKCPAQGKKCSKCHKLNHFASCCLSKNPDKKGVNCVDECSDDKFFIGYITSVNSVDTSEWRENLKIEDNVVKVQLDTGAKVNVISTKVLQDFASRYPCEKTQVKLKSYSGHQIPTKGVVTLICECKGNTFQVNFHVVEMEAPTLLAKALFLARVHLLQQQSPSKCPEGMAQKMYEQYSDLFQVLGCIPGEHTIKVYSSISPVVHPPRKVPFSLIEKIKEKLDRMEKADVQSTPDNSNLQGKSKKVPVIGSSSYWELEENSRE